MRTGWESPAGRWCQAVGGGAACEGACWPSRCRCWHPRPVRCDLRCAGRGRHRPAGSCPRRRRGRMPILRNSCAMPPAASPRGGVPLNADITLICERPKIAPHAAAMRARLAALLGCEAERVSVKVATTTEGLGFPGRGEGIAAQAARVSLLLLPLIPPWRGRIQHVHPAGTGPRGPPPLPHGPAVARRARMPVGQRRCRPQPPPEEGAATGSPPAARRGNPRILPAAAGRARMQGWCRSTAPGCAPAAPRSGAPWSSAPGPLPRFPRCGPGQKW